MLDQVVAIVDDDIILASELQERVAASVRSTMESRGVEMPDEETLVRETLDRLILDSIQTQLLINMAFASPMPSSTNP